MRSIILATVALSLAGCSFSVPLTGRIGDDLAQGQATAASSGGTFSVATTRGLMCNGQYDATSRAPTITTPVSCNDGRSGNLIITRTLDGLSGTVIGRFNDGTEAQFVFGNLTFDQAFNGSGARIR